MDKRKVKGSVLTVIGFILSPLSWWNDLLVNIPIAYLFGLLVSLISKKLFLPGVILGYWITNIAGLMLMHHGIEGIVSKRKYTKKALIQDIIISILYSLIIVVLIKLGLVSFPSEYFN